MFRVHTVQLDGTDPLKQNAETKPLCSILRGEDLASLAHPMLVQDNENENEVTHDESRTAISPEVLQAAVNDVGDDVQT